MLPHMAASPRVITLSPLSPLCFLFAQGCAESRHHLPGAPEADPGCYPVPPSPGYPNARPRRAGLTAEQDGESDVTAAAADTLVCADRPCNREEVREGRKEQSFRRATLLRPLPHFLVLLSFPVFHGPLGDELPSCSDGGTAEK